MVEVDWVVGIVVRTVDGLEVRWVADEEGLKENGSGVDSDTKAGTDENFAPLLRVGDWILIIARSDKEFISFLSPLFFLFVCYKFLKSVSHDVGKEKISEDFFYCEEKIESNRKREKRC